LSQGEQLGKIGPSAAKDVHSPPCVGDFESVTHEQFDP
jgi:hypothetical protein